MEGKYGNKWPTGWQEWEAESLYLQMQIGRGGGGMDDGGRQTDRYIGR